MKRTGSVVVLAASGTLLAACGSSKEGDALPMPRGGAQSTTAIAFDPPGVDVPKVSSPVVASAFAGRRPCDALTQVQTDELDIATVGESDIGNAEGPLCEWKNDETTLQGWFVAGPQKGLAGLYEMHKMSPYKIFDPIPDIAGHPAVTADAVPVRDGRCLMSAGLTDQQIVGIQASARPSSPHYKSTCVFSHDAAEAMVTTMKGGA